MSETGFVLDSSVVSEIARGDASLIAMLFGLESKGFSLVVPALVVASVTAEVVEPTGFLPAVRGIARLDNGIYGSLGDFDDALELGRAAGRLGAAVSWPDAHTVMLARLWRAQILTLDVARWSDYDLDGVHVTEIADPEG
ncbi:hypothetical protein Acor_16520 [Acrocarpospora corrugata]|uniref:PIN domain-containing protein n=1 Tax=Acrocarpospora corrugata TaxID=35763 RepID=A0A5M3VTN6_9ACTN|nr:hypothetical protein [Acrocarpospora corrugata]GER99588.1 hypothetical protein Acor_16520 [Acrocarpospora corrugata]